MPAYNKCIDTRCQKNANRPNALCPDCQRIADEQNEQAEGATEKKRRIWAWTHSKADTRDHRHGRDE